MLIYRKPTLKRIVWDWQRGRHSNIPKCCRVWFYIRSYGGWSMFVSSRHVEWIWAAFNDRYSKAQYCRCPLCVLTGRVEELHICTQKCAGQIGASVRAKRKNDGFRFALSPETLDFAEALNNGMEPGSGAFGADFIWLGHDEVPMILMPDDADEYLKKHNKRVRRYFGDV